METSGDVEVFTAGGMKALTVTAQDNDRNHIDNQVGESASEERSSKSLSGQRSLLA